MNLVAMASGLPLALTGITVVFLALGLVSLFIALLPRVLRTLERFFPESMTSAGEATVSLATGPQSAAQTAAVAAAIAAIVHQAHPPTPTSTGRP